jgi:hypothetical protein
MSKFRLAVWFVQSPFRRKLLRAAFWLAMSRGGRVALAMLAARYARRRRTAWI